MSINKQVLVVITFLVAIGRLNKTGLSYQPVLKKNVEVVVYSHCTKGNIFSDQSLLHWLWSVNGRIYIVMPEVSLRLCQISMVELFAKIVTHLTAFRR